jgi:NAD(P)-dependent dehydrogenase (short-subunit alcohol dehydrogenase family)
LPLRPWWDSLRGQRPPQSRARSDDETVAARANEIGDAAVAVQAELSDPEQVRAYTDGTVERWRGLHVAFNKAGVNLPGVFHEVPDEIIDRTLNVTIFTRS